MVKIDTDLLYLWLENARIRLKELSKKLQKSSQRLKYSLIVLEKRGIIKDAYCIFDYSYFGIILFRVYFKGGYISEKDKEQILKKLYDNPYIVSIYEMSGEFDLALEIASPNPSRFNKELKKIRALIQTLNSYKVLLNIVTHMYPRSYLIKNLKLMESPTHHIIGGDRTIETFTKPEMAIMRNMSINPKIRLTKLAKKSRISVKTVTKILKNLRERNIIKGFKHTLDTDKIGLDKFRLFLKLHNLSPEKEDELMNHMLNTKEIVQVNKTVGDWDMEIDIEAFDKIRIRSLITEFREKFKELIETFNLIEFYKYYKRSYLPLYIFEIKNFK